jgi:hypothetical protein
MSGAWLLLRVNLFYQWMVVPHLDRHSFP